MASGLTIFTGPLDETLTFPNDTKVQTVLLKFWDIRHGPGTGTETNSQKLQAVLQDLSNYIQTEVKTHERHVRRMAAVEAIDNDVETEFDLGT